MPMTFSDMYFAKTTPPDTAMPVANPWAATAPPATLIGFCWNDGHQNQSCHWAHVWYKFGRLSQPLSSLHPWPRRPFPIAPFHMPPCWTVLVGLIHVMQHFVLVLIAFHVKKQNANIFSRITKKGYLWSYCYLLGFFVFWPIRFILQIYFIFAKKLDER